MLCLQIDNISKACDDYEQGPKLDVTNIQSYQALTQQLRNTLCHIRDLRSSEVLKGHATRDVTMV